jgi:hypothetical protein
MRLSVSIDVWLKPKALHLEKKIKRILIFIMHYKAASMEFQVTKSRVPTAPSNTVSASSNEPHS